jgi:hypothetical protein
LRGHGWVIFLERQTVKQGEALYKDEILDRLARQGNVAQFVAFRTNARTTLNQSFARIAGHEPNELFFDPHEAISALLSASIEHRVNVRSYVPDETRSREFVYGLDKVDDVLAAVNRLSSEGLQTIVNETIDIHDGGVSGVVQGHTIEFSPDDTPRCVEKPGVASLPFGQGIELLKTVYGFAPEIHANEGERTEFSIHPRPRGWRRSHTLLWEHERGVPSTPLPTIRWPNNFSRTIGDKAFGLVVAHGLGISVPRTLVIGRRVAPFEFGKPTGSKEVWTRTCPAEPQPGLYTTVKGWIDPFALLEKEDPQHNILASVLRQDAVQAQYSGAAIVGADGQITIEGRHGDGDKFMLGLDRPELLPDNIRSDVLIIHKRIAQMLGPVRIEWVHDGHQTWLVQLHLGSTTTVGSTIVPGEPLAWKKFYVKDGLAQLRGMIERLSSGVGIILVGEIGVTSHFADLVRRAGVPTRLTIKE